MSAIVLDETEDSATVVRLMKWRRSLLPEALPRHLKLANAYFTVPTYIGNRMVLNLRYRKTVRKTELFELGVGEIVFKVKETEVDALGKLAQEKIQQQEQKLPENRRMARDEKLEVGLIVQTLVSVLVLVFA